MATNNYYGFTHAGTQYGTQYTASPNNIPVAGTQYPHSQQQQQQQQQQYSSVQGASVPLGQNYGSPTDQSNYMIGGYTRSIAQATPQTQQSYYTTQQQAVMGNSGQQQSYSPAQQTPAGTNASAGYQSYLQPVSIQSQQPTGSTPAAKAPSFTNYDAAVYNAVTAYAQGSTGGGGGGRPHGGLGFTKRGGGSGGGGGHHLNKMKGPRPMSNKPLTLHYCDVCKISCAGPQTYKEHLDGQKHKKKEISMKAAAVPVAKGTPVGLRCELCDVVCTGSDAYAAHIRGAKHQKVLKLHTKLGKPIPSDHPTVVAPAGVTSTIASTTAVSQPKLGNTSATAAKIASNNVSPTIGKFVKPAVPAVAPKINFIGPKSDTERFLSTTTASKTDNNTTLSTSYPLPTVSGSGTITPAGCSAPMLVINDTSTPGKSMSPILDYPDRDKEIQPVGQDYIEEMRTDDGKGISFNCKLCDCKFNDPNAKEMHMKGRRHRLQYKKKVNPDLVVDMKPSSRQKKLEERRSPRSGGRRGVDVYTRGPPMPLFPPMQPRNYGHSPANFGPYVPPLVRRNDSIEDRHVMAKHAEIYPTEDELQAIQKIVSATEKALKYVSDAIAEDDATKAADLLLVQTQAEEVVKTEPELAEPGLAEPGLTEPGLTEEKNMPAPTEAIKTKPRTEAELQAHRTLKGVMRVGDLAKGLLLKGDRSVQLVVLCSVKPTLSLLNRVFDALPNQLKIVSPDEAYDINKVVENASVVLSSTTEPKIEVLVTLTSPLLRTGPVPAPAPEEGAAAGEATATTETNEPDDLLDKDKCLDALAALRHAKWFQARATAVQSCVILIRVLRELGKRVPAWNCLHPWSIELLTEKSISTAGPVTPGEALQLVFEVISSGVILPAGPGLLDPCEKDPTDALCAISAQGREDVTLYAQQALRQISFGQTHKVLGIEEIPEYNKANSRKRRRNSASGEQDETDSTTTDGKKDKKEDSVEEEVKTVDVDSGDAEVKTEPV